MYFKFTKLIKEKLKYQKELVLEKERVGGNVLVRHPNH